MTLEEQFLLVWATIIVVAKRHSWSPPPLKSNIVDPDVKVGGETLKHKMQSHQLTSTSVWKNETLLKDYSFGAWSACQLTLVRFRLRANKGVLLGICVHDS